MEYARRQWMPILLSNCKIINIWTSVDAPGMRWAHLGCATHSVLATSQDVWRATLYQRRRYLGPLMASAAVDAMDMEYSPAEGNLPASILIRGEVLLDAYIQLEKLLDLRPDATRIVVENSPGGALYGGIHLARFINAVSKSTFRGAWPVRQRQSRLARAIS